MFMKNITLCVIICCVVSLFVGLPFAEAHPTDTPPTHATFAFRNAFENAMGDLNDAYLEEEKLETIYGKANEIVEDLLGEWDKNKAAIKGGIWDTVDYAIATLIGEIVRSANQDEDDDIIDVIIDALPAIFLAYQAAKEVIEVSENIAERDDYLLALNTAVGALNEILAKNQEAFAAYETKYDAYVEIMQNHGDGLVRMPEHNPTEDYANVTAEPLEVIKRTVKAKNAYHTTDSANKLKLWYHVADLKSTSQPPVERFERFCNFDDFWYLGELPKDKKWGGVAINGSKPP